MDKIIHMDELKPQDFISFVDAFKDPNLLEISEKIDGQNISFGTDDTDTFFTKTKKSKPVYDIDFYGDIPFMQGIKRFHTGISERMEVYKTYKDAMKCSHVQVFAELLPTAQTNTLRYADGWIGSHGAAVIFDVKVDGKSVTDMLDILSMCFGLRGSGYWQVYPKPIIEIDAFEVRHLNLLKRLYDKYSDILVSRKKIDKELKLKAKSAIQTVMNNIKAQFISELLVGRTSMFGNITPEGLIVRDPTNNLIVKIVDKDGFTGANMEQHKVSQQIKNLHRSVLKQIKEQIFGNADILKNFSKVVEKARDNFFMKSQLDATYTYKGINDVLQVIVDDMIDENRISQSVSKTLDMMDLVLAEYRMKLDAINAKWLATSTDGLGDSVILVTDSAISREFDMHYRIKTDLSTKNWDDVYINILHFVLGDTKIKELKDEFNV